MKDKLRALTDSEEARLTEIEYYLFVKHLLTEYNQSVLIFDILETLATLFNCNVTTIKQMAVGIKTNSHYIVPEKQEIAVMLYRKNIPTRKIRTLAGIHPQTLYRMLEEHIATGQFEYGARTSGQESIEIAKFMKQLDNLNNWRT